MFLVLKKYYGVRRVTMFFFCFKLLYVISSVLTAWVFDGFFFNSIPLLAFLDKNLATKKSINPKKLKS